MFRGVGHVRICGLKYGQVTTLLHPSLIRQTVLRARIPVSRKELAKKVMLSGGPSFRGTCYRQVKVAIRDCSKRSLERSIACVSII